MITVRSTAKYSDETKAVYTKIIFDTIRDFSDKANRISPNESSAAVIARYLRTLPPNNSYFVVGTCQIFKTPECFTVIDYTDFSPDDDITIIEWM